MYTSVFAAYNNDHRRLPMTKPCCVDAPQKDAFALWRGSRPRAVAEYGLCKTGPTRSLRALLSLLPLRKGSENSEDAYTAVMYHGGHSEQVFALPETLLTGFQGEAPTASPRPLTPTIPLDVHTQACKDCKQSRDVSDDSAREALLREGERTR